MSSIVPLRTHLYKFGRILSTGARSLNTNSLILWPRHPRSITNRQPVPTVPTRRSFRINSFFPTQSIIRSQASQSQLTSSSIINLQRARRRLPSASQPSIESFYNTDPNPNPDVLPPIQIFHPP
jgi:hypothetical protein